MPTLREIAAAAGVSTYTVSMVVNGRAKEGRISPEQAERVRAIADKMRYRPHSGARAMRSKRSRHLGVLIRNDDEHPFTADQSHYTILGINRGLQEAGYILSVIRIGDVQKKLEEHSRVFGERVLDGMILLSNLPDAVEERVSDLFERTLFVDCNVWRPTRCLRRDEREAGRLAAGHAAAAGYPRILWLSHPHDVNWDGTLHYSHVNRRAGVLEAAEGAGLDADELYVRAQYTPETDDAIGRFLERGVAVVASDIYKVRLVMRSAMARRLVPGVDFGLVCCEDVPTLDWDLPDLSRVSFDRYGMGREAARMMLELLEKNTEPESAELSGEWVEGTTLRSPADAGGTA